MADNTISGTSNLFTLASSATSSSSSSSTSLTSGLSMEDFLTLMVAQLENQDMYNTVDNAEFINQMAAFTSIQTMTELYEMTQANYSLSMVGRNVVIETDDGTQIEGVVDSAYVGTSPDKILIDGEYYSVDNVVQIGDAE